MLAGGKLRDAQSHHNFNIRPDDSPLLEQHFPANVASLKRPAGTEPLVELPVDNQALTHRHPLGPRPLPALPELKPNNRQRRPPIGTQTFRPLTELEGCECQQASGEAASLTTATLDFATACASVVPRVGDIENHPLANATVDRTIEDQVKRQLGYQFDWVMTYPDPAAQHVQEDSLDSPEPVTYGCNLVRRKEGDNKADTFTFLTTRLDADEVKPPSEGRRELEEQISSALTLSAEPTQGNLKSKCSTETMEQAVSPSLTQVSEGGSFASRGGSFSGPRIEDSLEEIDRLEEEIEAVNNYTNSPRMSAPECKPTERSSGTPSSANKTGKRVTIAPGSSATVRIKPSEKMRPALRRSNSMDLRENQPQRINAAPEQKAAGSLSRSKSTTLRTVESKTSVKSSKPVTVPHFELPGEAVSRRLKQQREARQAQQAEAQKTTVAPPKPRSSKPLTRPNFELPGEAISRRKREEREAKLRAQEEEEKKRREFKAKPIRSSITNTLPRDTIASRARQSKSGPEEILASKDSVRSKRLSTSNSLSRLSAVSAAQSPQGRGRNSVVLPSEEGSRATSVSTNLSEKRSSVSLEDISQQRLRGREVYARDNNYRQDREKEKREREMATRSAREQAAERSRAASREWAEKQRLREAARRESLRASEPVRAQR